MKKLFALIFSVLIFTRGFSQLWEFPVSLLGGTKFLQKSYFDKQLSSFFFAGICFGGELNVSPRSTCRPNIYYGQFLPQELKLSDSVNGKISGCQFGFTYIGFGRRFKNHHIDVMPGFTAGRLKITGNGLASSQNPFFSPKIAIKHTVYLSRIFVSATIEGEYDVSKSPWKKLESASIEGQVLDDISQTGLTAMIHIGYMIKYKNDRDKKIAKNKKNDKKSKKKKNI